MNGPSVRRIRDAKIEAEAARKRLIATLGTLQKRLKPGTLASQAWSGVKEKSGEIADDAVEAVRHRPVVASGVAAGLLLFLAREPILSAAGRLINGDTAKKPRKEPGAAPRRSSRRNEGVSA